MLTPFRGGNEIDIEQLRGTVTRAFEAAGLKIFGPRAKAAQLESSKAFAKEFMRRHRIPTADYREFTDSAEALDFCRSAKFTRRTISVIKMAISTKLPKKPYSSPIVQKIKSVLWTGIKI